MLQGASFALFRALLASIAFMSLVCLVVYFLSPQPYSRYVGTIYKPDKLLLASFIAGFFPWVLCLMFARPVHWSFHVFSLVGVVSGLLFLFVVYFDIAPA
jgi:hypothetical protein